MAAPCGSPLLDPNVKPRNPRQRHLSPIEEHHTKSPCIPESAVIFGADVAYAGSLVSFNRAGLVTP